MLLKKIIGKYQVPCSIDPSKNILFIRTSKKSDSTYQHILKNNYRTSQIIIGENTSGFKKKAAFDIIKVLEFLILKATQKNITIEIADWSRLTRSTIIINKIRRLFKKCKMQLFIINNNQKFEFTDINIFEKIIEPAIEDAEASSLEKSRISKLNAKARREKNTIKKFIRDTIIFGLFDQSNNLIDPEILVSIFVPCGYKIDYDTIVNNRINYPKKIKLFKTFKSNNYFRCSKTGLRVICPPDFNFYEYDNLSCEDVGISIDTAVNLSQGHILCTNICYKKDSDEPLDNLSNISNELNNIDSNMEID